MTGPGYYQRRHIRQMEKWRKSKIVHLEEETKWQPLNIPCMGKKCHCYSSESCKGRSVCNALF
jgi:hypothetical protein